MCKTYPAFIGSIPPAPRPQMRTAAKPDGIRLLSVSSFGHRPNSRPYSGSWVLLARGHNTMETMETGARQVRRRRSEQKEKVINKVLMCANIQTAAPIRTHGARPQTLTFNSSALKASSILHLLPCRHSNRDYNNQSVNEKLSATRVWTA